MISREKIIIAIGVIALILWALTAYNKNKSRNTSDGSTERAIGCGKCAVDFDLEMKAASHTVPQYNGTSNFNTAMLNRAVNNLIICTGATIDSK